MANVFVQDSTMSAIGEAIREKTGGVALIYPKDMAAQISSIKTGAVLQEKTIAPTTSQQEVVPDAEYDGLSKVTVEAMQVSNTESPVIEVSAEGLIQASVQHNEGYVAADKKTTSNKQLPTQAAKAVTPSANEQVAVEAGVFTTGAVTVAGDANLVPENIKSGVSLFGVEGTHEGGIDIQLIEGMEIPLDLSDGDQPLVAPDGYAIKSATIKKPTTLVPENIAKDVNIAGVIGTLETGGDGDIEMGMTVYATMSGQPNSLSNSASTKTGSFYIEYVPEDAELEWLSFSARVYLANTSTGEETTLENVNLAWPVEYTETETGIAYPGYNRLTFKEYSYAKPANEWMSTQTNKNVALFRLPNIYVKDKILYAAPNCKGLLMGNFENNPSDIEGIDLRGSQVKTLPNKFGNYRKNLKKIWLSEVYTFQYVNPIGDIFSQLEEIHFTATTPPTLYSYRNFDSLPTTCKIYVPAGYLDAYTSAQYYPDPTKYTYIEE